MVVHEGQNAWIGGAPSGLSEENVPVVHNGENTYSLEGSSSCHIFSEDGFCVSRAHPLDLVWLSGSDLVWLSLRKNYLCLQSLWPAYWRWWRRKTDNSPSFSVWSRQGRVREKETEDKMHETSLHMHAGKTWRDGDRSSRRKGQEVKGMERERSLGHKQRVRAHENSEKRGPTGNNADARTATKLRTASFSFFVICCNRRFCFHRHSCWLYIQQQSSSSSSNRFIEHDVSTRKLGPFSGIRPSFLNRSIYTFLLLRLGVATHRLKLFWKNAKLFLEISSCVNGSV